MAKFVNPRYRNIIRAPIYTIRKLPSTNNIVIICRFSDSCQTVILKFSVALQRKQANARTDLHFHVNLALGRKN